MSTRKQAMETKCWECMGKYIDGKVDCRITKCPLYQWMPYRESDADQELFAFNPRRIGEVLRGSENSSQSDLETDEALTATPIATTDSEV